MQLILSLEGWASSIEEPFNICLVASDKDYSLSMHYLQSLLWHLSRLLSQEASHENNLSILTNIFIKTNTLFHNSLNSAEISGQHPQIEWIDCVFDDFISWFVLWIGDSGAA